MNPTYTSTSGLSLPAAGGSGPRPSVGPGTPRSHDVRPGFSRRRGRAGHPRLGVGAGLGSATSVGNPPTGTPTRGWRLSIRPFLSLAPGLARPSPPPTAIPGVQAQVVSPTLLWRGDSPAGGVVTRTRVGRWPGGWGGVPSGAEAERCPFTRLRRPPRPASARVDRLGPLTLAVGGGVRSGST